MTRISILTAAATAALIGFGATAQAADLPAYEAAPVIAVPSFSWTGFYIGAQAGYGWTKVVGALKPKGALVGAYAGYNVQLDASPLVFGVETDFNWSDQDEKLGGGLLKTDVKWSGATRGRVGFAFDRFLAYGAAGVAYTKVKVNFIGLTASQSQVGWTAGGGVEYAFTDNVVGRGEYRYADYGTKRGVDITENRVMGGVGYKF